MCAVSQSTYTYKTTVLTTLEGVYSREGFNERFEGWQQCAHALTIVNPKVTNTSVTKHVIRCC